MEITLGIPTLNRYDLLQRALESAEAGEVKPDKYLIIDNGGKFQMNEFYHSLGDRLVVHNFGENLGVAGSWNKLCQLSSDIRIISNDDIRFFEDTIKLLVENYGEKRIVYPAGIPAANSFSCYLIPDSVIETVGYFDEAISPNYAYYEDNDYYRRMVLLGVPLVGIGNCRVNHSPSSTLENLNLIEKKKHHDKFKIAQTRYKKKWGGLPGEETLTVPREI